MGVALVRAGRPQEAMGHFEAALAGLVVLAPFVWMGLALGNRIHVGLTQQQMRRAIGVVLIFTGGSLLVRALVAA